MTVEESDDQLPDAPGTRVFYSSYEPREVLGRGVSSTVRRCIHKDTGLEYAVKIIDISAAENGAELRSSTYREVQVLRRVQGHRYIIQLHDMFESDTHLFLVFELLREGELFDYLTTVVALSEKRTRLMMRQLLQAISYLHRQFVVHRDVKPENILLDEDCSTIKLTDFGFARCLMTTEGGDAVVESAVDCQLMEVLGTPGYMAPEILRAGLYHDSGGYGRPVDVWAAGVVMYTLLVGCPPFWHRKQMIMLRNIMEGRYSFGSPEWDDITEAPKNLIRRMLCVDPRQRITADQALKHEFFCGPVARAEAEPLAGSHPVPTPLSPAKPSQQPFLARAKFRLAVNCARAVIRIQRLKFTPEAIPVRVLISDPYALRAVRRTVDACAFRIYGHWVKKAVGQNRAMLFENECRAELVRGTSDTPHRIHVVGY